MSETNQTPARAGRRSVPASEDVPPAGSAVPLGSFHGADHRLDRPHAAADSHDHPADEAGGEPALAQSGGRPRTGSRVSREQRELLLQASQIAEQLQDQFHELDRRESSLNEQLAALDHERRSLRLRVQQHEDEMLDREETLRGQQAEFAHKFATCEKLVGELEQQQEDLTLARAALDAERAGLREELGRDLSVERAALRQAQAAAEAERQQQRREIAEYRNQCDAWLESERAELADERGRLHESVTAELARERSEFDKERTKWAAQRDRELAELRHEREINEEALARAQQELLFARREQETEAERRTGELQAHLDRLRAELDEELKQKQADCDARREAEAAEMSRERELAEEALRLSEDELRQLREQQQQQLRAEREEFERDCETRRQQIKQERAVLENRMQFQQDHLHKTRQELEAAQHEWRVHEQRSRSELERRFELGRLRANQLDHYRALLDEREQSLEREQQLLARGRRTAEADVGRQKARLRQEQDVWEQERRAQQAEVRRQQDLLALHAENLEARRDRLDHLRSELEETHRRTLEMRMSIEEAWAQLTQAAGAEKARQRLDQAAAALDDHYSRLSQSIGKQRQELLDAQKAVQQQRDDLQGERRQLSDWIAEREQAFRDWEQQLRQEADAIEARGSQWQSARDEWMQEKVAAEGVIRNLLSQLSEASEDAPDGDEVSAK